MKDTVIKQAIVTGVVNTSGLNSLKADDLYRSVLWNDTVKKIKPYNLIKNYKLANDVTGLLSDWIKFISDGADNESAATRRIERAFRRISSEYASTLPEIIKGEGNLTLMLRVLFLPINELMQLNADSRLAATAISHILQIIFLLDLIFSQDNYRNLTQEQWLFRLLANSSCIQVLDMLDTGTGGSEDG